jgi:large subunit ribosomal protein L21
MYAVIVTGGKQYRVSEGDVLKVEKLEAPLGQSIQLDKVLLVSNGEEIAVGSPYLDSCSVAADVVNHGRGKKIRIIKFRRRKNSVKHQGHRQDYTELKITGIKAANIQSSKKS